MLGVRRDQHDVPSGIIPLIYRDYLRTGNGVEMPRIFYHNRVDLLSMVTLVYRLACIFERPVDELEEGAEWFSLARWYESLGMTAEAEDGYNRAIGAELPPGLHRAALDRLGWLLKRVGRRDQAAGVWRQLAAVAGADAVRGHVELAKYHEWHTKDLAAAADWTRRALSLAGVRETARPELIHRLARLERKLAVPNRRRPQENK